MFAVLKTGGKQYGCRRVTFCAWNALPHKLVEKVQFNEILMIGGDAPRDRHAHCGRCWRGRPR